MASYRALVVLNGQLSQQKDADTLIVGAGISTTTGASGYVVLGSALTFLSRTTAQRDALVLPGASTTLWNSTTLTLDTYNGTAWLSEATQQYVDLNSDPAAPTTTYSNTYTGMQLTQEQWKHGLLLYKQIDYTYTGSRLTQQVSRIYADDGVTLVKQMTQTFTYTGSRRTGGTIS